MVVFIEGKSEVTKLTEMASCQLLSFFIKANGSMTCLTEKLEKSIILTHFTKASFVMELNWVRATIVGTKMNTM